MFLGCCLWDISKERGLLQFRPFVNPLKAGIRAFRQSFGGLGSASAQDEISDESSEVD